MTRQQIKTAAMKLDPVDREALAEELLLSVTKAERKTIDAAWLVEAKKRDAALATNKSGALPVDQVIHRLKSKARP